MLSFGYFGQPAAAVERFLHKQRKVTRARKGVKASDFTAWTLIKKNQSSEAMQVQSFRSPSGNESLSLLVQEALYGSRRLTKVTKETHPVLAPSALRAPGPQSG
ncbi:hypothetical protein [Xanthomonas vesicatoria]|uniref:hypothetical protein n=1 Tax=Xanthomonas vesicatoria TaxID=56460 RepID=UPI001E2BF285|nr:hypothetical protein [Xanthomonas vesicatoria]MCC8619314.1 hypothetical protein [Xanthomonas vesicatoria]MCC8625374.1 hypothetical protein [Xanthomonas vesicatoria]MCC8632554.1 hypothetical protein [Xanthomonas vesicatoria]MDG4482224.1 hypothetical protein [Xanthomonas vesicatoria]